MNASVDLTKLSVGREAAALLHELHAACFENTWSNEEMGSLLAVPTTKAWIGQIGEPVAFVILTMVQPEAEIVSIGCVEKVRRQKVTTRLLSGVLDDLKNSGFCMVHLEVNETNEAALELYDRLGFETVGRRPNYYQGKEGRQDALLLRLNL